MALSSALASANLPITVIKLGGSVLTGETGLDLAAREVARVLARGNRVVVVTSAFRGTTDRLIASAKSLWSDPSSEAFASLLATGETTSAAFVSLALTARSIPNELLDPDRIDLRVQGPLLDGDPVSIDVEAIEKSLSSRRVVVVPGFFGRGRSGRIALLGRGGSDLTALFVAVQLGASCHLVKDVNGLYCSDPSTPPSGRRRYSLASWDELARVGGGLVQAKAIEFARRHRLSFTIGAPLSDTPTLVGAVTAVPGPTS